MFIIGNMDIYIQIFRLFIFIQHTDNICSLLLSLSCENVKLYWLYVTVLTCSTDSADFVTCKNEACCRIIAVSM